MPRFTFESLGQPTACSYKHEDVLKALDFRDPESAREAMKEHLITSGDVLADLLDEQGFWSET